MGIKVLSQHDTDPQPALAGIVFFYFQQRNCHAEWPALYSHFPSPDQEKKEKCEYDIQKKAEQNVMEMFKY